MSVEKEEIRELFVEKLRDPITDHIISLDYFEEPITCQCGNSFNSAGHNGICPICRAEIKPAHQPNKLLKEITELGKVICEQHPQKISELQNTCDVLEQENQRQADEMLVSTAKLNEKKKIIEAMRQRAGALEKEHQALAGEFAELQAKFKAQSKALQESQQANTQLQEKISELEGRKKALEEALKELDSQLQALHPSPIAASPEEKQDAAATDRVGALSENPVQTNVALQAENAALKAKKNQLTKSLRTSKNVPNSEEANEKLRTQIETHQAATQNANDQLNQIELRSQQIKEESSKLRGEIAAAEKNKQQAVQARQAERDKALAEKQAKMKAIKASLAQRKEEIAQQRAKQEQIPEEQEAGLSPESSSPSLSPKAAAQDPSSPDAHPETKANPAVAASESKVSGNPRRVPLSQLQRREQIGLALSALIDAAKAGNADAQTVIGLCYAAGLYVEEDKAKGVQFLKAAIATGKNDGWAELCLLTIGPALDPSHKLAMLKKAAEKGVILAYMMIAGHPTIADEERIHYFERASDLGDWRGSEALARYYSDPVDSKPGEHLQAQQFATLAAQQKNDDAQRWSAYTPKLKEKVGERAVSLQWLVEEMAHSRNIWACCLLGVICMGDEYVEQDMVRAANWLKLAAYEGQNATAQFHLGKCYEKGWGVEKDRAQADALYQLAAKQGFSEYYQLGCVYRDGCGVASDTKKAISFFVLAALQKHSLAEKAVIEMVPIEDMKRSFITKCVRSNKRASSAEMKKNPLQGYQNERNSISLNELSEAQRQKMGFRPAQEFEPHEQVCKEDFLGFLHFFGEEFPADDNRSIPKNFSMAVYYLSVAAWKEKRAVVLHQLGMCYLSGMGTSKNESAAVFLFKLAAEQNFPEAQNKLGACYEMGVGTREDINQAIQYYQEAADQGLADAQFNLGRMYEQAIKSIGVEEENQAEQKRFYEAEAQHLFALAAEQGHPKAIKKVALAQKLAEEKSDGGMDVSMLPVAGQSNQGFEIPAGVGSLLGSQGFAAASRLNDGGSMLEESACVQEGASPAPE